NELLDRKSAHRATFSLKTEELSTVALVASPKALSGRPSGRPTLSFGATGNVIYRERSNLTNLSSRRHQKCGFALCWTKREPACRQSVGRRSTDRVRTGR